MIRLWVYGAIAAAIIAAVFAYGEKRNHDGKEAIRTEWHAAEDKMLDTGRKAKDDAEVSVSRLPPPGGKPCGVRDPYNRDCH